MGLSPRRWPHSVWKSQKKSHSVLRAKRVPFRFRTSKSSWKIVHFDESWQPELFGQAGLPERSLFIGEKLVENGKTEKFKCDIFSDFQTLWTCWFTCWHFKNYICVFGAKIQMISQWGKVLHKMWIPWLLILANLIMKANRCARPQFWTWRALIVGKKRWLNEDIYNSARAQALLS